MALDATPEEFLNDIKRIRTWLDSLEKNIKKAVSEEKYNEDTINTPYMYLIQGIGDMEDAYISLESRVKDEEVVDTGNISALSELPIRTVAEKSFILTDDYYREYCEVLEPKPEEVLDTLRYVYQEWKKRDAVTKDEIAQAEQKIETNIPLTLEEMRKEMRITTTSRVSPRPKPVFAVIPENILQTQPENSKEILDLVGHLLNKDYDWNPITLLLGNPTA